MSPKAVRRNALWLCTDRDGRGTGDAPQYHLVEADDVDGALAVFLQSSGATPLTVQKYPGLQAVATARAGETVFIVNVLPGSDTFQRNK